MTTVPLRIAFVTGGLPFGGSTTFLLHICAGIRAAGSVCEIFSLTRGNPMHQDFAQSGVPVHTCDERRWIFEDRLHQTYEGIAKFNANIVVANIGQDAYEFLTLVPTGVVRVGIIHDRFMVPSILIPLFQDVLDHVVVIARHLLEDIAATATKVPCTYVAHGVSFPPELPPRDPNPEDRLKLIYFGRITESKGAKIFPLIVESLNQAKVPFRWTIHGEGSEKAWLEGRLATEVAAGVVTFSNPVGRDELLPIVRKHDVYLLASEIEGGPLTLLEAMGLGLVPVCGNIPCLMQQVITPENGFLVSRESASEYAEAIRQLHSDRPRLERMSVAAQSKINDDFTVAAMTKRYLALFEKLMPITSLGGWPPYRGVGALRSLHGKWTAHPGLRHLRRLMKLLIKNKL